MPLKRIFGLILIFLILVSIIFFYLYRLNFDSPSSTVNNIIPDKITVVVDRFEGKYAVCEDEDKSIIKIEKNIVPQGVKEGDVLNINGSTISIDIKETRKRMKEADKLLNESWSN